jgi:hypothetical protein
MLCGQPFQVVLWEMSPKEHSFSLRKSLVKSLEPFAFRGRLSMILVLEFEPGRLSEQMNLQTTETAQNSSPVRSVKF